MEEALRGRPGVGAIALRLADARRIAPPLLSGSSHETMKLNHVGIVTRDLVATGASYQRTLGLEPLSEVLEDPLQKVRAQFWRDAGGSVVELIEPTGPDSPIWREAQKGGGLNHLCYETPDLEQTIREATGQ